MNIIVNVKSINANRGFFILKNKVVQIKGEVTGFDSTLLILNNSLICAPEGGEKIDVEIGRVITVKGRCVSFDDLLLELRLDHVFLVDRN